MLQSSHMHSGISFLKINYISLISLIVLQASELAGYVQHKSTRFNFRGGSEYVTAVLEIASSRCSHRAEVTFASVFLNKSALSKYTGLHLKIISMEGFSRCWSRKCRCKVYSARASQVNSFITSTSRIFLFPLGLSLASWQAVIRAS